MSKKFIGIIVAVVSIIVVVVIAESALRRPGGPKPQDGGAVAQNQGAGGSENASALKILPSSPLRNVVTKASLNTKDFKGKVLLLNFWASWCEACVEEMPSLIKLSDSLKDEGFLLVSINLDENQEKAVPEAIRSLHINFPVYTDIDEALVHAFNVVALPFNVAVDRNMNIAWSESGARDWASDAVIKEFRGLLKNQ